MESAAEFNSHIPNSNHSDPEEAHQSLNKDTDQAKASVSLPPQTEQPPPRWFRKFVDVRDKTLFDWVQVVASVVGSVTIPLLIYLLSAQQAKTAEDNQRHEIMSKYYDEMTNLLIDKQMRQSTEVRAMARARTLSTFRQLEKDGERRGQVLKFLYETNLIGQCKAKDPKNLQLKQCEEPILDLGDAKLEGTKFDSSVLLPGIDLSHASLNKAVLPGIDLTKADMKAARFRSANLSKALLDDAVLETANLEAANLSEASLSRTKLKGAILKEANLQGANLKNADLTNANLQGADLRGADLTGAKLQGAELKDALYNVKTYSLENNETKFPSGFSPMEKGLSLEQSSRTQSYESST